MFNAEKEIFINSIVAFGPAGDKLISDQPYLCREPLMDDLRNAVRLYPLETLRPALGIPGMVAYVAAHGTLGDVGYSLPLVMFCILVLYLVRI